MTLGILCPGQSAQSRQMLDMLKGEAEALAVFEAFGRVMGMWIEAVLASDVEAVQIDLVARHCHVTQLRVNVASHTPLMADAVSNFRRALEAISFADVKSRIVAGVDGSFVSGRRDAIDKLTSQLVTTIDWAKCMLSLREGGCSVSLELLPGADLTAMVQSQEPSLKARSLSQFRSLPGTVAWACRILDG